MNMANNIKYAPCAWMYYLEAFDSLLIPNCCDGYLLFLHKKDLHFSSNPVKKNLNFDVSNLNFKHGTVCIRFRGDNY